MRFTPSAFYCDYSAIRGSASARRNRTRCPAGRRRSGALSKNLARAADAVKVVYVSRPLIRLPDKARVRQLQRDGNERELARNRSASNSDTIAFTPFARLVFIAA